MCCLYTGVARGPVPGMRHWARTMLGSRSVTPCICPLRQGLSHAGLMLMLGPHARAGSSASTGSYFVFSLLFLNYESGKIPNNMKIKHDS